MRLEKKDWISPRTGFQEFVPQEFIAACDPDATYVNVLFWCDANISAYGGARRHHVYYDNGDGVFGPGDTNAQGSGWTYSPCMKQHEIKNVEKSKLETTLDSVFPKGWLVPLNGWGSEHTGQARAVRIYQPDRSNYEDLHCTFALNLDEFTVHNPS